MCERRATAASASNMVKKLDGLGLVRHVPYRGVQLTPAGARVALEVIRHHRLLELFLLEKAFYEIVYEAANRPDWLAIPIAGVLDILDGRTPVDDLAP